MLGSLTAAVWTLKSPMTAAAPTARNRAARRKEVMIGSRQLQKAQLYLLRNDLAKQGEKLKEKNSKKKGIEEMFFKMLPSQDFYVSNC